DLGATKLFAATAETPVKVLGAFAGELRALCSWLEQHQVRAVAMEATGVYWIPVHDLLQAQGFKVTLFHGAHARNLPGRKSDVSDCQWHAMLHSHGLLRACFIPSGTDPQTAQLLSPARGSPLDGRGAHRAHAAGPGFNECAAPSRPEPAPRSERAAS